MIMIKNNEFLSTEPVGKLLFKLAIPTIAAQVINMLYNVVDRIYIGHMPEVGDLALTGVGVCMPIIMIVSAFAALVASGGAPRASIFMGKGDKDTAERIMGTCFSAQIIVSAIITAVLLIWNEDILLAFGASEDTIEYALEYMNVYAAGTIFVQLTLGMNSYITAQGFTKISMLTVIIGAVANIILDPIFIYGLDMGVRGAAVATIISQGISCVWVVLFLFGKKTVLRLKSQTLSIDVKLLLPCIALGSAHFIMQASESVIFICFNTSLRTYGGDIAVGAMTILTSVMQFAMMPLQGLAQGSQPITSYNFGAKNATRVKRVFKILLAVSLSYSVLLWAFIMLLPRTFAGIFTPEPELIEFAASALRIYCAALGIFGLQIACQMTFVSLGNAKASVLVAVVRKFVLLLPLIYLMPAILEDKTTAVYLAEPIADVIAVTFTGVLFYFQFKKSIASIEHPSDVGKTE